MQIQGDFQGQVKANLIASYYLTLQLFYLTGDLSQNINYYKDLWFKKYSQLSIIGSIVKIQKISVNQQTKAYCPLIKLTFNQEQRLLVIQENQFKTQLSKRFNQIFRMIPPKINNQQTNENSEILGNGQINEHTQIKQLSKIYYFSNLTPCFLQNKLCFKFTSQTHFLKLNSNYYNEHISKLEAIFKQVYSQQCFFKYINSLPELNQKSKGYNLGELRKYINVEPEAHPLVSGRIEIDGTNNYSKGLKREMKIKLHQTVVKYGSNSIGIIDLRIRYYLDQQDQLFSKIKQGYNCAFLHPRKIVTERCQIIYEIDDFNKIIVLEQNLKMPLQIQNHYKLRFSHLINLNEPVLKRNLMKFRIDVVKLQIVTFKYNCIKCKKQQLKAQICPQCKQEGELDIWALMQIQDSSSVGYGNFQTKEFLKMINLNDQTLKFIKKICIQRGNFLFYGQHEKNHRELIQFYRKMKQTLFFSLVVIAIPYFEHRKTFKQKLNQQERVKFQRNSQTTFQFLNTINVNLNGAIQGDKKKVNFQMVPSIKIKNLYFNREMPQTNNQYYD